MPETMVDIEAGPAEQAEHLRRLVQRLQREHLTKQAQTLISQIDSTATRLQAALNALVPMQDETGLEVVAKMKSAEGGAWTGKDLQERWNLSSATLHKRRSQHRIVFWRDALHDYHYPKWQFTEAGAIFPGIQDILQIFNSQDEWRVMRYFLGRRDQLGEKRPLDLLRDGKIDMVVDHARRHAEENTW